jgi:hypothetical protein
MSEQQVETQNVSTPQVSDTIIKETVANALRDELPKIKSELAPTSTGVSSEQLAQIMAQERQRLADQILGKPAEPEVSPILKSLVNNPDAFVETIASYTEEKVARALEAKELKESERQALYEEQKKAFDQVVSPRSDILSSDSTKKVWASCYQQTDPSKSQEDRMREAVVEFDKIMDGIGVDRTKLSSALSIPGGSGAPAMTAVQQEKSMEESDRASQREKHLAWKKAMGMD